MHLTGIKLCEFVQKFSGEIKVERVSFAMKERLTLTTLLYDKEFMDEVMNKLHLAAHDVAELMENEKHQDELLSQLTIKPS